MNKRLSGFTIVELLIVITVIGILAAIVIVAYNSVSARADTASRLTELKQWERMYRSYAVVNGHYPDVPRDERYCLGTDFPDMDGSGLGNCRDLYSNDTRHQVNATLNTMLKTIGTLPNGPRTSPGANALGPFAVYWTGGDIEITDIFKGSVCPDGTTAGYIYDGGVAIMCKINLPAVN